MKNIFLHTNKDLQFKSTTTDPLAEYDADLKTLNLVFYSTINKEVWKQIRGWLKSLSKDAFNEASVKLNQLGYSHNFQETGHLIPIGALSDIFTDIVKGGRTFSIVSSNTAHSMSAPLSRAAFLVHGWSNSKVKLVINFDYHEDYGRGTASPLVKRRVADNGAWGQSHVCDDWAGIPNVTYIYAAIGTGSGGNTSTIKSLKYTNRIAGTQATKTYTSGNLRDLVDGPCDVYITVDRDVFPNKRTHFPVKGAWNADMVKKELKAILAALAPKLINVVGADITGLPKFDNSYTSKGGDKASFNTAVEEIKTLHKNISSYFLE